MKKGKGKKGESYLGLISRYVILLIVGIFHQKIFYFIFTPLTIYPVYFILSLFFDTSMISNIILVKGLPIEIIGPCIAGSAYYLLLMLNLSIPKMDFKKRTNVLLFSFVSLWGINLIRILSLTFIFLLGPSFFDVTHKLFWYLGSTILVVLVWFLCVKLFEIKEIPFYSDIKLLLKNSSGKKTKKSKSSKKH